MGILALCKKTTRGSNGILKQRGWIRSSDQQLQDPPVSVPQCLWPTPEVAGHSELNRYDQNMSSLGEPSSLLKMYHLQGAVVVSFLCPGSSPITKSDDER